MILVYQDAESTWQSNTIASGDLEIGTNTAEIVTGSGVGLKWNTFVYGSAEEGIASVRVTSLSDATGGQVVDGLWVVASTDENVQLGSLTTEYLDREGQVVATH